MTTTETPSGQAAAETKSIQIFVNNKPVQMPQKVATGLQIKEAAIAQQVKIELDFVLFEDLGNGKQEIVDNNKEVKLHEHQRFEAVSNDDHS